MSVHPLPRSPLTLWNNVYASFPKATSNHHVCADNVRISNSRPDFYPEHWAYIFNLPITISIKTSNENTFKDKLTYFRPFSNPGDLESLSW